ncbi:MAG: hypothetical protein GF331_23615, partial [Chitinivibrionales bacterium]|nr:hypothetical protein [Chitinivibrionales bacterium]
MATTNITWQWATILLVMLSPAAGLSIVANADERTALPECGNAAGMDEHPGVRTPTLATRSPESSVQPSSVNVLDDIGDAPASDERWSLQDEQEGAAPRDTGTCTCHNLTLAERDVGIVWRGPPPGPSAEHIARLIAPVLWFSPDEPLLADSGRIPAPLPCDHPTDSAVVYYQLIDVYLRKDAETDEHAELRETTIDAIEGGKIRFYFYYPFDIGFDSHRHDIEAADFYVTVERLRDDCYQVRLRSVVAHAHGVEWYWNELDVMPDTRLPVVLLVEEGKHATSPDRNADGYYAPGYDVNDRINDAWGVRDILGSS